MSASWKRKFEARRQHRREAGRQPWPTECFRPPMAKACVDRGGVWVEVEVMPDRPRPLVYDVEEYGSTRREYKCSTLCRYLLLPPPTASSPAPRGSCGECALTTGEGRRKDVSETFDGGLQVQGACYPAILIPGIMGSAA